FFQADDGIRDFHVTGVQTCALPIYISQTLPKAWARREHRTDFCPQSYTEMHHFYSALLTHTIWTNTSFHSQLHRSISASIEVARSEERRVGKDSWSRASGSRGARGV